MLTSNITQTRKSELFQETNFGIVIYTKIGKTRQQATIEDDYEVVFQSLFMAGFTSHASSNTAQLAEQLIH